MNKWTDQCPVRAAVCLLQRCYCSTSPPAHPVSVTLLPAQEVGVCLYILLNLERLLWPLWPKQYGTLWRTVWLFLQKVHRELPYDPEIPLLGKYPKELKAATQTHTCKPVFIAYLLCHSLRSWHHSRHFQDILSLCFYPNPSHLQVTAAFPCGPVQSTFHGAARGIALEWNRPHHSLVNNLPMVSDFKDNKTQPSHY